MQRAEEQLEHDLRMAELDAQINAAMDELADAQIVQQRTNCSEKKVKDLGAASASSR